MTPAVEALFSAVSNGRVPPIWLAVSFPSRKSLANYFEDLLARVAMLDSWVSKGPPNVFWLSGFFHPHAFLTGVLQQCARHRSVAIDDLEFTFQYLTEAEAPPQGDVVVQGLHLQVSS